MRGPPLLSLSIKVGLILFAVVAGALASAALWELETSRLQARALADLFMGQRGLPRRHITLMYASWALGSLALVGFGLATAVWQLMAISFVEGAFFTTGLIVWGTLVHTLVPAGLLGRVTSLDWFVSTSLVPISFALTGPAAAWIGVETTLVAGGVIGCAATLLFLFVRGVRDTERPGALEVASQAAISRPNE